MQFLLQQQQITHLDVIWSLDSNNTPVTGIKGPFLKIVLNLRTWEEHRRVSKGLTTPHLDMRAILLFLDATLIAASEQASVFKHTVAKFNFDQKSLWVNFNSFNSKFSPDFGTPMPPIFFLNFRFDFSPQCVEHRSNASLQFFFC